MAGWSTARLNAVDVALWGLRIGVVAVVVAGTAGTLIKGRYNAAQWVDFVMFGLTIGSRMLRDFEERGELEVSKLTMFGGEHALKPACMVA